MRFNRIDDFWIWPKLILLILILLFLFSSPPIRLAESSYKSNPAKVKKEETLKFLLAEYQKAVDEIKMRISQQDAWFHYKFLLIGALAGAFLASMGLGIERRRNLEDFDLHNFMRSFFESKITVFGMAIACVLSIVIDVHVRNDTLVANQLGNWISEYIEPTFRIIDDYLPSSKYLSWESFLRDSSSGYGMHVDKFYSLTFWPHLHGLTFIIYIFYLFTLRRSMINSFFKDETIEYYNIIGFYVVHTSFFAFSWSAHTVPDNFRTMIPFIKYGASSSINLIIFFIFSVILTYLAYSIVCQTFTHNIIAAWADRISKSGARGSEEDNWYKAKRELSKLGTNALNFKKLWERDTV